MDLTAEDFRELVARYKDIIKKAGKEFPQDPWEQLWGAIEAVVRSWMNERARVYRRMYRIPEDMGTAVNVQAMVFGNLGNRSGTGVCFTRDPATGENRLYGEFLLNAQGEDVVAGIRTPNPIAKSAKTEPTQISLEEAMPEVYQELLRIREVLERHYRDMQDVEFTIEEGKLYILQTRSGKRTGFAAVRIAVEMAEEGLITEDEAILRIDPAEQLSQLLQPIFDPKAKARAKVLAKGLAAGPGAATGRIALSAQRAEEMAKEGPVILVRHETSRTTSGAWPPRRASSRPGAASPPTPRWWPARSEKSRWWAARPSTSTTGSARSAWPGRSCARAIGSPSTAPREKCSSERSQPSQARWCRSSSPRP